MTEGLVYFDGIVDDGVGCEVICSGEGLAGFTLDGDDCFAN